MTRENRTHGKFSHTSGKITRNCTTIVLDERAQPALKISLQGYSPLLDETPGQPEFKKLRKHPKIALLMKQPGHRMVLRAKKEDDEITQKEVLVYNAKNDLCGKLVWKPEDGVQFFLIS